MFSQSLNNGIVSSSNSQTLNGSMTSKFILTCGLKHLKIDAGSFENVSLANIPRNEEESDKSNSDDASSRISDQCLGHERRTTYLIQFMFSAVTGYAVGMQ